MIKTAKKGLRHLQQQQRRPLHPHNAPTSCSTVPRNAFHFLSSPPSLSLSLSLSFSPCFMFFFYSRPPLSDVFFPLSLSHPPPPLPPPPPPPPPLTSLPLKYGRVTVARASPAGRRHMLLANYLWWMNFIGRMTRVRLSPRRRLLPALIRVICCPVNGAAIGSPKVSTCKRGGIPCLEINEQLVSERERERERERESTTTTRILELDAGLLIRNAVAAQLFSSNAWARELGELA